LIGIHSSLSIRTFYFITCSVLDEGWTCKRCTTLNDDTANLCETCEVGREGNITYNLN